MCSPPRIKRGLFFRSGYRFIFIILLSHETLLYWRHKLLSSLRQMDISSFSKVSESNILCSDAWRSYSMFARQKGLDHYSIKSTEAHVKKGIYHIQNVNNYHKRLKDWLAHFNGIASKYLNNYLAWFRFLDSKG